MKSKEIEVVRFSVVGVLNTAVGLATIFVAKAALGLGDVVANLLGYGVGLAMSFVLNKRWTFGDAGGAVPAAVRFVLAFVAAYLLNLLTVLSLRDHFLVDAYVAQALGVVPYTIVFFLLSRSFVFQSQGLKESGKR